MAYKIPLVAFIAVRHFNFLSVSPKSWYPTQKNWVQSLGAISNFKLVVSVACVAGQDILLTTIGISQLT